MAKSTVQKTRSELSEEDGSKREVVQYSTTIPKQLAEFFELEQGDTLEWTNGSARNKMEVTIKTDDN